MTFWTLNRAVHRWVSYVLLVPIAFWFISGVFMSWSELKVVRGEHNMAERPHPSLAGGALTDVLSGVEGVQSVTVRDLGGHYGVHIQHASGEGLFDPTSGAALGPISENEARAIASADFAPEFPVSSTVLLEGKAPIDYRRRMPVWRVTMADPESTVLYIDPISARVTARRTDHWRVFDFMWMLHIHDFEERSDINNPLLKLTSALAALFLLTGGVLIVQHMRLLRF